MAGESPDRSKQQKSSGETTPPGSAVPPEPAAPPSPAASAADSETGEAREDGDTVDQPTTALTFRAKDAEASKDDAKAEDDTADAESTKAAKAGKPADRGKAEKAEKAEKPADRAKVDAGDPAEATEAEGDARLKAAVAAWVSGGEDEPETGPDADPEKASDDASERTGDEAGDAAPTAGESPAEPDDAEQPEAKEPDAEKPDAEQPDAKEPKAKQPEAKQPEESEESDGEEAEREQDGDRTAVLRAIPKPPAAPEAAKADAADAVSSEPSADPEPKPEPKAEPKAGAAAEGERASRFVPLRSPDEPSRPPAPPAPPAPAALPSAQAPSQADAEYTRQQPLPPLPGQRPLDLLAELTNKPAPPETPMRTLVRRVKIWTPLLVLLVLVVIGAQLLRPLPDPQLQLTAQATHTFDGEKPPIAWPENGQAALEVDGLGSLGTSGEQKPVPIASVAKTMTAYLLLRDHPMKAGTDGSKIPVDKQAEEDAGLSSQGESTVDVKEGETLTQREALNAVMIASANNVARLVARWDSKSEEAFVKKMNDTAEELGMKNTTYTDPSGLRKETVSTAEDQVKLGRAAMKLDAFRESVRLPSYKDRNGTQQNNWNRLVPSYGTVGIKTGTTTAAGGNLLFAAEKEIGGTRQLIIGAVLSQHRPPIIDSVLAAGKDLILSAQEALESEVIVKKGTVVGAVDDQLGGTTPLVVTEDVSAVGWPGLKVQLRLKEGADGVPREAEAGTGVGELTVGRGPGQVRVPVELEEELTEPSTGARLTRVL